MCFWWLPSIWGNIIFLRMSGGYLLFEEVYFYFGCPYWFVLNKLEILVDVYSGKTVTLIVKLTNSGTGYILNVNIRCDSGGYLLFEELYFSWEKLVVTLSLRNYIFSWGCHYLFVLKKLEMLVNVSSEKMSPLLKNWFNI